MATIDSILDDLKAQRFSEALDQAAEWATRDLQGYHAKRDSFREPGFYPYLRLFQAYALAGLERHDEADTLIAREIACQRSGHMRTDFIMAHYIALGAIVARQKEGTIAAGMVRFEDLLDKANVTFSSRGNRDPRYLRADMHDIIVNQLGMPLIHNVVQRSIPDLVQKLREKSYYFTNPVASGDYDMPKEMTSMPRIPVMA